MAWKIDLRVYNWVYLNDSSDVRNSDIPISVGDKYILYTFHINDQGNEETSTFSLKVFDKWLEMERVEDVLKDIIARSKSARANDKLTKVRQLKNLCSELGYSLIKNENT